MGAGSLWHGDGPAWEALGPGGECGFSGGRKLAVDPASGAGGYLWQWVGQSDDTQVVSGSQSRLQVGITTKALKTSCLSPTPRNCDLIGLRCGLGSRVLKAPGDSNV